VVAPHLVKQGNSFLTASGFPAEIHVLNDQVNRVDFQGTQALGRGGGPEYRGAMQ
jgi:hypothetical protein